MEIDQFGAFSFALIVLTMADGILGSAVDLGVLRNVTEEKIDREVQPIESAGLVLKLGIGFVCLIASALFGDWAGQRFLHLEGGRWVFLPVGVSILTIFAYRSQQVLAQARERFREFGQMEMLHLLLRCGLVLAALFNGWTHPGAILSLFAVAPVLTLLLARKWKFGWWPWHATVVDEIRRLLDFLKNSLAATALGSLASRLDLLCLGWLSPAPVMGRYTAAQSLALMPELVATYTASALAPWINPRLRDGSFRRFFLIVNGAGLAMATVGAVVGVVLAEWIITTLLSAKYQGTGEILRILLPGYCASAILFPLTLNFLLFHSPRAFILYDSAVSPILLCVYYAAGLEYGAIGIATVATGARILKTVVLQYYAWRHIDNVRI